MPTTQTPEVSLVRLATAGSVDDGKSTLVGRLLHDSKSVLTDQLASAEAVSRNRGQDTPDLALLTDGLRAEREQGITIDVAYRYFATGKRRFILADTPGHVQYTRNMVTGASTAELVIVLVDARNGVIEQTRRHLAVAALLRVPRVVLTVNKMDLVSWDAEVFARIAAEFTDYATALGVPSVTAIPVSALTGANVVNRSADADWYGGPTLLEHLENTSSQSDAVVDVPLRLPVQYVIRSQRADHLDYRGYAGQLAQGTLRVGDSVTILPSGHTTVVTGIDLLGHGVQTALAPQSVTVRLADDLDIGRGDLIAATHRAPVPTRDIAATVCHLDERPLRVGQQVLLKHTTRTVNAFVRRISHLVDVETLERIPDPAELAVNDIGLVELATAEAIAPDPYTEATGTGSFLLIDPTDGATRTAGMVDQHQ